MPLLARIRYRISCRFHERFLLLPAIRVARAGPSVPRREKRIVRLPRREVAANHSMAPFVHVLCCVKVQAALLEAALQILTRLRPRNYIAQNTLPAPPALAGSFQRSPSVRLAGQSRTADDLCRSSDIILMPIPFSSWPSVAWLPPRRPSRSRPLRPPHTYLRHEVLDRRKVWEAACPPASLWILAGPHVWPSCTRACLDVPDGCLRAWFGAPICQACVPHAGHVLPKSSPLCCAGTRRCRIKVLRLAYGAVLYAKDPPLMNPMR